MDLKLNLAEYRIQFLICYYIFIYFGAMSTITEIGEYKLKR